MENLKYTVQARATLNEIRSKSISPEMKKLLLQSFKNQLKQALKNQSISSQSDLGKFETSTTFFTEEKTCLYKEEEDTMIEKILGKQRMKI